MNKAPHIIEQQHLEVTFTDRREGMGLQDQLATIYKEKVLPLLESVLNDHDVQDYTIQIDEITIDAGVLTAKNWEQELVERSVQQFKTILQKKLLSPWPKFPAVSPVGDAAEKKRDATEGDGVQWVPETTFQYNRLVQFVTSGAMPVNDNRHTIKETIMLLLNNKAEWQTPPNREAWFRLLLTNRQALERLIRQCNDIAEEIMDWLNEAPIGREPFYGKLSAIHDLYTKRSLAYSLALIKKAQVQGLMDTHDLVAPLSLLRSIMDNNKHATALQDIIEEAGVSVHNLLTTSQKPKPTAIKEEATQQEGSTFHIYNAGLIILYPFLAPFFGKVGLLDEQQQWVSTAAQQRAVLLSQYLVTGEESIPEFYLPLNKLLCGYPLTATLDDQLETTATEKREAAALLTSVIEHWSALKKTSIDALRVTFLQRAGKLTQTEKGWQLQVEQKSFDILVQSIPWTIGRIKTPWMQEWLLTDWV